MPLLVVTALPLPYQMKQDTQSIPGPFRVLQDLSQGLSYQRRRAVQLHITPNKHEACRIQNERQSISCCYGKCSNQTQMSSALKTSERWLNAPCTGTFSSQSSCSLPAQWCRLNFQKVSRYFLPSPAIKSIASSCSSKQKNTGLQLNLSRHVPGLLYSHRNQHMPTVVVGQN